MSENYPSTGLHIRNLAQLPGAYEVIETSGPFRIVRINPPYFEGYAYWVVNERGFFWEPAESVEQARRYLESDEARSYQPESD
jgi:hypothetical protein